LKQIATEKEQFNSNFSQTRKFNFSVKCYNFILKDKGSLDYKIEEKRMKNQFGIQKFLFMEIGGSFVEFDGVGDFCTDGGLLGCLFGDF
jgi:hypothetical protein